MTPELKERATLDRVIHEPARLMIVTVVTTNRPASVR